MLAADFGLGAIDATRAFWFIGFAEGPADVGELRLYEHSTTRKHLALDSEGGAYSWCREIEGYSRIRGIEALIGALT